MDMESGNSEEIPERFKDLPEYAISSLYNPMVLDYIKLLNSEKLYEVCQIRGLIMYYHSGLYNYIFNKADLNWNDLSEKIEKFMATEPYVSKILLEYFHFGFDKNNNAKPRLYEIANQTWNISTDLDHLKRAWININDPKLIRAYKKNTLPPNEAKKVINLEQVEREVEAEFGDRFYDKTMVGKVFQLLSSKGREEKRQLSILRDEWNIKMKQHAGLSMMGNDPYVKGYFSYIYSHVCAGTQDWKKAIKELKSALENGFDAESVLGLLITLLNGMKKYDEAEIYAQKLLDICPYLSEETDNDYSQDILSIFQQTGRKPLVANRIWESKSKENEQNVSSIIAEKESDIISARNENVNLRTKGGLELLDKLVPIESSDIAMNNNTPLSELEVENKLIDILEFSLEEIEPFNKVETEKLLKIYQEKINLFDLLSINEDMIYIHFGEFSDKFDTIVSIFPNTLACIPVAKKKIEYLLSKEKIDFARKLSEHIINKRKNKVLDIYNSIKPLITFYHNHQEWNQEIELISKSRKILLDDELKQATDNLIEAYLEALANEKSLNNKNRVLLEIESENLVDERLIKIKKEVDAQLNRRKQILTKIGIGVGIAIIIFILVYFLFL
ncbi:MAG: hypothetical protein K9H48_19415 [Melioribacteraceae bacterium]|nr:hypothetical protein [Melioribacteraceae bacterium]